MQWNSFSEFFIMGGYGQYVWGSFGLTATVMALEMLQIRRQRKALLKNIRNTVYSESPAS